MRGKLTHHGLLYRCCTTMRLAYPSWFVIQMLDYHERLAYPSWFVIQMLDYHEVGLPIMVCYTDAVLP